MSVQSSLYLEGLFTQDCTQRWRLNFKRATEWEKEQYGKWKAKFAQETEKITKKQSKREIEYLVEWKEFPNDPSWESAKTLIAKGY
jgi:hypothetical protein